MRFRQVDLLWPATLRIPYPPGVRICLVLIALLGCKSSGDKPPAKPPDLDVIGAGVDPRHVLRYAIAKGANGCSRDCASDVVSVRSR